MGILYLNIGFVIINFILGLINVCVWIKDKDTNLFCGIFSLIVCLVCTWNSIIVYNSRMTEAKEQSEIEAYYEVRSIVEKIKTDTTMVNKSEILYFIQPKIDEINDIIEENKTHYNSGWNGMAYSEKIGKLEKIRPY